MRLTLEDIEKMFKRLEDKEATEITHTLWDGTKVVAHLKYGTEIPCLDIFPKEDKQNG